MVLEFLCRGYAPDGTVQPSWIDVSTNGAHLTRVQPPRETGPLRISIPVDRFGPDGRMWLRLDISDPRRPADFERSGDRRRLGLFVQSVHLAPSG